VGVDLEHAVDAQFGAGAGARAWEQRGARGDEDFIFDRGAVHVGVRTDQDRITDQRGVGSPAAHQGVLHHHAVLSEVDLTVFRSQYCAVQHPAAFAEHDGSTQHG
jgi:hypothetical protein